MSLRSEGGIFTLSVKEALICKRLFLRKLTLKQDAWKTSLLMHNFVAKNNVYPMGKEKEAS